MYDSMNKPTYVAFSTQKGGAGKTTITVLVASYLHYVKGYNVAVVDCDFPQYSIHDMRRRDMDMAMKDDHYKAMAYEQFKRLDKKAYPVLCCKPEDATETAAKLAEAGLPVDFVFFDLPGTINNPSIVKTIAAMDYIFCPIVADRVVMTSSMQFATVINEHMVSTGKTNIKGLYMLWNMVDGREKTELYSAYEKSARSWHSRYWKPACRTASVSARRPRRNARRYSVRRSSLRTGRSCGAATSICWSMKF